MTTLKRFIERNRIRAAVEVSDSNPLMDDGATKMNHYRVTLRCSRRQMTVPFSMGLGLTREPTAEDVLDCLASDSSGVANAGSFEEWCGEYGYDTDSRKAERTYKACERQAAQLEQLLGPIEYQELLWKTERL